MLCTYVCMCVFMHASAQRVLPQLEFERTFGPELHRAASGQERDAFYRDLWTMTPRSSLSSSSHPPANPLLLSAHSISSSSASPSSSSPSLSLSRRASAEVSQLPASSHPVASPPLPLLVSAAAASPLSVSPPPPPSFNSRYRTDFEELQVCSCLLL